MSQPRSQSPRRPSCTTQPRRASHAARGATLTAVAASVAAILPLAPAALAQTAGMMSFQAVLKDGGGVPVIGAVTLEIEIYDAPTLGTKLDANGDGAVNSGDKFVVPATAVEGVISIKYGPIAPSVFGATSRWLNVSVTSPVLPPLTRVEIVTPPAIAEQLNARGTGTPALIATPAGDIGIGTNAPLDKLHIEDDNGRLLFGATPSSGGYTATFQLDDVGLKLGHNSSGRDFQIQTNATTRMTITPGGNVGIGTTNPQEEAHLAGAGSIFFRAESSNGDAGFNMFSSGAGQCAMYSPGGTDDIRFHAGGADRVAILSNGNVGIGTVGPAKFMDLNSAAFEIVMRRSNAPADQRAWRFGNGGTSFAIEAVNDALTGGQSVITMLRNGSVGIGRVPNGSWGLEVQGSTWISSDLSVLGNLSVVGSICGTYTGVCSDVRFKKNVTALGECLSTVERLRPVRYEWRSREFPERRFEDKPQIGFIAQEVEKLVSEVVLQGSDGYYMVDYGRLTPLLTAAIQELHAKHNTETTALKSTVSNLKSQISDLESRDRAQAAVIDDLTRRLAVIESQLAAAPAAGGR